MTGLRALTAHVLFVYCPCHVPGFISLKPTSRHSLNGLENYCSSARAIVSVGVVGAAAPTDFVESSFYNLNFHTKIPLAVVFGAYLKFCTHCFEILTRFLIYIDPFS